ncbi:hypothetical protein MSAN_00273600 [Mycena sanguinolenta]|uniref:Uncharacterized protein n=1 Tax=Mycena sanguinolenta TaxID=230812 RepID=A0A8H6ZJ45_9AGAR|nr:hypothetical protein MSAN_00273600 [Mycena sanguinolenta]
MKSPTSTLCFIAYLWRHRRRHVVDDLRLRVRHSRCRLPPARLPIEPACWRLRYAPQLPANRLPRPDLELPVTELCAPVAFSHEPFTIVFGAGQPSYRLWDSVSVFLRLRLARSSATVLLLSTRVVLVIPLTIVSLSTNTLGRHPYAYDAGPETKYGVVSIRAFLYL